jgi:hypothetical protein
MVNASWESDIEEVSHLLHRTVTVEEFGGEPTAAESCRTVAHRVSLSGTELDSLKFLAWTKHEDKHPQARESLESTILGYYMLLCAIESSFFLQGPTKSCFHHLRRLIWISRP